jgi:putative methionine-R-sulfoxide reductase with GAF domain
MTESGDESIPNRDAEIRRLKTLLRVSKIMNAEANRAKVIERINDEVRSYLEADRFTVFFHDTDTDELYSYIASGLTYGEIRIPSTAGIAGLVFASREVLRLADAYADPRFDGEIDKRTGYRTKSLLCMPIINQRGTCIGVVQALNKTTGDNQFADEDVDFLKDLVEQIGDLLDLLLHKEKLARRQAAMQESLSRLAVYDYLLGDKTATKVAMRWNRKLHLWIGVIGTAGITLMAITGIVVAHVRGYSYTTMLDMHTGKAFLPRNLAFTYSDLTGVFLAIVTLTGVVLWLYPVLTRWLRQRLEAKKPS